MLLGESYLCDLFKVASVAFRNDRGTGLKIWLITVGEPLPTDLGVPRLLRAGIMVNMLAKWGHDVLWWTSTFDHILKSQRAETDTLIRVDGYRIWMLRSKGYPHNLSPRRFLEHSGVARKFRVYAERESRPDIILCSYPTIELSREAVRYGLMHGVPVVLDIRDLWPDVFFDIFPPGLRWLGRIGLFWLTKQAQYALRRCAGIVGISDGYLEWGLHHAQRPRNEYDAVFPLGYLPPIADVAMLQDVGVRLGHIGVSTDKTLCWFVGSFSRQFDMAPVIAAARAMQANGRKDVQFVLSGEGDLLQQVRDSAQGLDNVIFTGWIGANEIAWLRQHASIGLQPYAAGARMGLANKLFEYLSAGLPIVSSLKGENEALLNAHSCGVSYRPGDGQELLAMLESLIDAPNLRKEMGDRGRRLFEERFSATTVYEGLGRHLERIAGQPAVKERK